MKRKKFISNLVFGGIGISAFGISSQEMKKIDEIKKTIFSTKDIKISLAQWSLHNMINNGEISPYDFPKLASEWGFSGIEHVNALYNDVMDSNNKNLALKTFIKKNNQLAKNYNIKNLMIMIDNEGDLCTNNKKMRLNAIENHYPWVETAAAMGCHSIRINLFVPSGTPYDVNDWKNTSIESLSKIGEYGESYGINILVENHGGLSSNAKLLLEVINTVDKNNCGTLPDFGNFCMRREGNERWDKKCMEEYDKYIGMEELMDKNLGSVSAKSYDFDNQGNETSIDYERMVEIIKKHNFSGYIGVEYGGGEYGGIPMSDPKGTIATRDLLLKLI